MIAIALVDIRFWFKLSYPIYAVRFAMLAGVEVAGKVGALGAQRWLNLGFVQIQPSELEKIALVMALARYYHARVNEEAARLRALVIPGLMILVPTALWFFLHHGDLFQHVLSWLPRGGPRQACGSRTRRGRPSGCSPSAARWHRPRAS